MKTIALERGGSRFTFQVPAGTYTFESGNFQLNDLAPALYMHGKKVPFGSWKPVKNTANSMTVRAEGKNGTWDLKANLDKDGKLTLGLSGKLKESCEDLAVWYFDGITVPADHLALQSRTMGGCHLMPLTGKGLQSADFDAALMMLITKKKEQLAVSVPLLGAHLETFGGTAEKGKITSFRAGFEIKHITSKTIRLKELSLRTGDGFQSLYAYGDENKKIERDLEPMAVPGWNSWDYYRWTITEDEVLENADFIARDPVLSKYVKKIIVDDGWQYAYGEWKANSYFPHGMKYLADELKKMKFKPGLWIAPTLIEPHSWIAQMEPEMLAKAESGQPTLCFECMRRHTFILDPTVEKSRKFIYDLFDGYANDGYEYFKLDFLGATCSARQFTDKTSGRGNLMAQTIGIAREATRDRAQILGCNYLYCGGEEPVDMVRAGGDIHARWDSVKGNTPSVAMRYWANKKLWVNDPDFALCRAFDTSDDPLLTRMVCCAVFVKPEDTDPNGPGSWKLVDFYRAQAEVLLSIVICAGGAVNLSDKVSRLNESGLDLARRTVAADSGEAALPLDMFSTALPKYWVQKVKDYHRVLLINWDDAPGVVRMNLNQLGLPSKNLTNFWNDQPVTAKNGVIETELPPRSCLFVTVR